MLKAFTYSCEGVGRVVVQRVVLLGSGKSPTFNVGIADSHPDSEPFVVLSGFTHDQIMDMIGKLQQAIVTP